MPIHLSKKQEMNNIQFFAATHMEYMTFLLGQPMFKSPAQLLRQIKTSIPAEDADLADQLDPVCFSSSKYCYAIGDLRIFQVVVDETRTVYQIVSKHTGVLAFALVEELFKRGHGEQAFGKAFDELDAQSLHPLLSQELTRVFGPNGENSPEKARTFAMITDFAVTRSYDDQAAALLDLLITALNELNMGTVLFYCPVPASIDHYHPLAFDPPEDLPVDWLSQRTAIFDTVQMANMFKLNQQFNSMQTLTQLGSCFFFNMPFFAHFTDSLTVT